MMNINSVIGDRGRAEMILRSCLFDVRFFSRAMAYNGKMVMVVYDKRTGQFTIN